MPIEYPYTILACVILCIECILFSFFTGRQRSKVFSREFLSENFEEEHIEAMNEEGVMTDISPGGFPDCGDGRYSEKLSYRDWYIFNQTVRAHINFVEALPGVITILALSGFVLPQLTNVVAYVTIGIRLFGFILVLCCNGRQRYVSCAKITYYFMSDFLVYILGFFSILILLGHEDGTNMNNV